MHLLNVFWARLPRRDAIERRKRGLRRKVRFKEITFYNIILNPGRLQG